MNLWPLYTSVSICCVSARELRGGHSSLISIDHVVPAQHAATRNPSCDRVLPSLGACSHASDRPSHEAVERLSQERQQKRMAAMLLNGASQGTTGPKLLRGPPSRGQQRGESNVLNAAQLQGLQSDALRMLPIREGCPPATSEAAWGKWSSPRGPVRAVVP